MRANVSILIVLISVSCSTAAERSQSNWQTVEADNGAAYKVDLNSISHYANGGAHIIVYAVERPGFDARNLRRLYFDCQGHYRGESGPIGQITYAPPRSVVGRISNIACAQPRPTEVSAAKYQSLYVLSGFLMRGGGVCGNADRFVNASTKLIGAVPSSIDSQITQQWSAKGADDFNSQLVRTGAKATCIMVEKALREAEGSQ
jgi:hypothetical protein